MSKPIIVGYDPKTLDQAPVRFAVAAARFTGAPLTIACVSASVALLERLGSGHVHDELAADATPALGAIKAELEATGIPVECRDLKGASAARALHEAAEAEDAGLLVVGSRREGPLGRVLPGSTAERLMHGAPCPIAVVPQGWQPGGGLRTIGVAYVDSEEGREALRGAYALARRAQARLRAITVEKLHLGMFGETEAHVGVRPAKSVEAVEGEHRVVVERALRAAVDELDGDVAVEAEAFVDEDPAQMLIDVSRHLDLLVCGSRGYGPVQAVLLGGVSRRVALNAHCPVIVLPRGVPAALEALMTDVAGAPSPA
jgi:nucleotide-binding universal stress UspA family protein